MRCSTCVAVNGELLTFSGLIAGSKTTAAVYKYDSVTNNWNLISKMPTARSNCLVAVLPATSEIMVVGGYAHYFFDLTDNVETWPIFFPYLDTYCDICACMQSLIYDLHWSVLCAIMLSNRLIDHILLYMLSAVTLVYMQV